jgi:hypothetical protein
MRIRLPKLLVERLTWNPKGGQVGSSLTTTAQPSKTDS